MQSQSLLDQSDIEPNLCYTALVLIEVIAGQWSLISSCPIKTLAHIITYQYTSRIITKPMISSYRDKKPTYFTSLPSIYSYWLTES